MSAALLKMTLEIPDEVAEAIRLPRADQERELRKELAVSLYARGILSLGPARRLAALTRWQFDELLSERRIVRDYSEQDLETDLRGLH